MDTTSDSFGIAATVTSRIKDLGLSAFALLLANALLLAMYFLFDLELFQLVVVYWVECLWIGVFSALKLIVASIAGSPYENRYVGFSPGAAVVTSVLAIGFIAAEFLAVFVIVGFALSFAHEALTPDGDGFLFTNMGLILGGSFLLLASHAVSFVANFLIGKEYRTARVVPLLLLPFTRCLALFGAIILALIIAKLVPALSNTAGFAIVLIVFKLAWDLRLHRREREKLGGARETAA